MLRIRPWGLRGVAARTLDIRLAIDPARARLWHRALADALRRRGHRVAIALRPGGPRPPAAIGLILALEGLTGARRSGASGCPWDDVQPCGGDAPPDLEIDLTGGAWDAAPLRRLAPVYAGALIEEAAVAELTSGGRPLIGVRDSHAAHTPAMMHPGLDAPHRIGRSLDNLGARLAVLLARAADAVAAGGVTAGAAPLDLTPTAAWRGGLALAPLRYALNRVLRALARGAPHWHVGWRRASAGRIQDTLALPAGGWSVLPDDGARFYADPFVFAQDGRTWLFVEDLPYATGRALISAVEIGPDGPVGAPTPVLERDVHLSYPFVFARDGQIWMIPESAGSATVDLYRAEAFPHRWVHHATLLSGIEVGDATIVEEAGRLWMFGSVGGSESSSWDALHIWSSDRLEGPWQPHGRNPVVLDALGARPAGAFFRRDGALWRPAQDCAAGYGAGLALCRVMQLDDDGFAQKIETVLAAGGPGWPGTGLHTLNWAAGIEVIDGCRTRNR